MGDIHEVGRARINTSMLARYIGQPVCFVGRVEKVHPSGSSFVLSDGAGKSTTVELSEPLDEELSGVIEVVGKVTPKATIMGISYIPFREDVGSFGLIGEVSINCVVYFPISSSRTVHESMVDCCPGRLMEMELADLGLYDEALKIIHEFPQYYPFGLKGAE